MFWWLSNRLLSNKCAVGLGGIVILYEIAPIIFFPSICHPFVGVSYIKKCDITVSGIISTEFSQTFPTRNSGFVMPFMYIFSVGLLLYTVQYSLYTYINGYSIKQCSQLQYQCTSLHISWQSTTNYTHCTVWRKLVIVWITWQCKQL